MIVLSINPVGPTVHCLYFSSDKVFSVRYYRCDRWGRKCVYLSANRFSMAWENGIQMPSTFFVFAWHWKTGLNFAFCFSFSLNFEKRFWTSYFFFRFCITLKNGYEFRFRIILKKGYEFRFSFSQVWILLFVFRFRLTLKNGFELRISFLVFSSLWKTDLNFICHLCMTWKTDHWASTVIWSPGHPLRVDRGIHFLRNWK